MKYKIKIRNYIENILKLVSKCIPKKKNKVIFGAWFGAKFSDNPKYLFLQAQKNNNIMPIWITKNKFVYNELKSKKYRVCKCYSLIGIWNQITAKYYFTCTGTGDVFEPIMGGAIKIDLWHGLPLKKILADDEKSSIKYQELINNYWKLNNKVYKENLYISSSSGIIDNIYKNAFMVEVSKLLRFGQPRNDVFYDDSLEDTDFPQKYKQKTIILYMPTHRQEGKVKLNLKDNLDFNYINTICKNNNAIFLIKKHFYHKNEIENIEGYEFIEEITDKEYDSQMLLKYTDYLITDYSSCYIDFLLLDRPVIYYAFDYNNYLSIDREMYFSYEDAAAGPIAKTFKELIQHIDNALDGKDFYKNKRKFVRDMYYSKENQNIVSYKYLDFIVERKY